MAGLVWQKDPINVTQAGFASAGVVSSVAGGTNDNTAQTGATIDRAGANAAGAAANDVLWDMPIGAVFDLMVDATMANTNTISVKNVKVEHSVDGTTWTTFQTFADAGVVLTGNVGGTAQQTIVRYGLNLSNANRYVRFDWTTDMSAAATDTARVACHALFTGMYEVPAGVL